MDEQNKIIEQVNAVIETLKKDTSYQKLAIVKEEMQENTSLLNKIEQVRKLQQQYVKSSMQDKTTEKALEQAQQELESIPLYQTYLELVSEFDSKLRMVESILDHFFLKVTQGK